MNITGLKIFVWDEDLFYLHIFQQYLTILGIQRIEIFQHPKEMIDKLTDEPDVVFIDCQMDLLTKYETLKKIKHYNPNIYVIMVADQMEYSPEALKYGAFDYLQKDSNELNQIRKVLQKITGIKHLLGKKYNSFQ